MDPLELKQIRGQLSDIYRDYRNSAMSRKYYECRLKRLKRLNLIYEVIIAIGTSGAVGGWAIWSQDLGKVVWVVIGSAVALLTIVKPLLKLPEEIERLTTLSTKYAALQIDFQLLIFDIKSEGRLGRAEKKVYKEICKKMQELAGKDDVAPKSKTLKKICEEVDREIPPGNLWTP